jgi:hypothetical protein
MRQNVGAEALEARSVDAAPHRGEAGHQDPHAWQRIVRQRQIDSQRRKAKAGQSLQKVTCWRRTRTCCGLKLRLERGRGFGLPKE